MVRNMGRRIFVTRYSTRFIVLSANSVYTPVVSQHQARQGLMTEPTTETF